MRVQLGVCAAIRAGPGYGRVGGRVRPVGARGRFLWAIAGRVRVRARARVWDGVQGGLRVR
ncbi:hypothetical protein, partial [Streptomyces milbemycinicus]|uniref:hypothetical protein n=1 Tax=Streptomyces milbemycinicus TaxID=476552 RepID=UPI001B80769E